MQAAIALLAATNSREWGQAGFEAYVEARGQVRALLVASKPDLHARVVD